MDIDPIFKATNPDFLLVRLTSKRFNKSGATTARGRKNEDFTTTKRKLGIHRNPWRSLDRAPRPGSCVCQWA